MSFRGYHEVTGADRSGLGAQVAAQGQRVADRLRSVRSVVAVVSGKGGVGKTFLTAALARGAARRHSRIGVLDADLKSPTAARALGATGPLRIDEEGVHPAVCESGIRVISSDLLLDEGAPLRWTGPQGSGHEFVWRGTLETAALRELLSDVAWGELDLLLVDMPPDADRLADLTALVPSLRGALFITIPSDESRRSVERAMRAAVESGIPVLGVVENMSGYLCPDCGETRPLFGGGAGEALAAAFGAPLMGRIPFSTHAAALEVPLGSLVQSFLAVVP
ncbi:MAG: P-loop NTPase [Gemmatimonadaceae bacterium]